MQNLSKVFLSLFIAILVISLVSALFAVNLIMTGRKQNVALRENIGDMIFEKKAEQQKLEEKDQKIKGLEKELKDSIKRWKEKEELLEKDSVERWEKEEGKYIKQLDGSAKELDKGAKELNNLAKLLDAEKAEKYSLLRDRDKEITDLKIGLGKSEQEKEGYKTKCELSEKSQANLEKWLEAEKAEKISLQTKLDKLVEEKASLEAKVSSSVSQSSQTTGSKNPSREIWDTLEVAKKFYKQNEYAKAMSEYNKVLMIDSTNKEALKYSAKAKKKLISQKTRKGKIEKVREVRKKRAKTEFLLGKVLFFPFYVIKDLITYLNG
ncbi:hypothetical protein KKC91_00030 [bacterium]|nr:hypothetical protein [bacterium]